MIKFKNGHTALTVQEALDILYNLLMVAEQATGKALDYREFAESVLCAESFQIVDEYVSSGKFWNDL